MAEAVPAVLEAVPAVLEAVPAVLEAVPVVAVLEAVSVLEAVVPGAELSVRTKIADKIFEAIKMMSMMTAMHKIEKIELSTMTKVVARTNTFLNSRLYSLCEWSIL